MLMKSLICLATMTVVSVIGCASASHEVITCTPPGADIYWGKIPAQLEKAGYKTPYSRSASRPGLDSRCYQVKKDGYHESDIVCREEEKYRYLDFSLTPMKTTITSHPAGAAIYWGPCEAKLARTPYNTPRSEEGVSSDPGWKDWCFQVKKEGYSDSEIIFKPKGSKDRYVHFKLKKKLKGAPASPLTVTLTWDDKSTNELGFEVERKVGSEGVFVRIATVGPNVTAYTDMDLSPGMTYFYRVRAYNTHGFSSYTEEIDIRTPTD